MTEFYRFFTKEELLLWKPYCSFRFVAPKTTEYGVYKNPKVMISIGRIIKRDVDKAKIRQLPLKTQDKLRNKYTLETFAKPNLSVKDALINKIIVLWKSAGKVLGVSMDKTEDSIEIYQYIKASAPEELEQFVVGLGMSLGCLAQMKHFKVQENEDYKKYLTAKFRMAYNKGLEMRI